MTVCTIDNTEVKMLDINRICVIGGDKRQIYMGKAMMKDGKNVIYYGFDNSDMIDEDYSDLAVAVSKSDCVILPMPLSKDGETIFTPLSGLTIPLDFKLSSILSGKTIFCTKKELLIKTGDYSDTQIYDYMEREELAVLNAVPTAEGAIEIAMRNCPKTINSCSCLVAGYGRIGKILSKSLSALGANVTVSARNLNDLTWIRLNGYNPIHTDDISLGGKYDLVFNTIPSMIFDEKVLSKTTGNTILIDLASVPGGVDFGAAEKLGIKAIQALSLPGKAAPETAGEIIKKTIYNIIEEELS